MWSSRVIRVGHGMIKYFAVFILIFSLSSKCFSEWKPDLRFSIEGAGYIETLTFVSGFSYALSYYIAYSKSMDGRNSVVCIDPRILTSEILVGLANEGLSGSVSSEEFSIYVVEALARKYSCSGEDNGAYR